MFHDLKDLEYLERKQWLANWDTAEPEPQYGTYVRLTYFNHNTHPIREDNTLRIFHPNPYPFEH